MKLIRRHYKNEDDFWRIRNFLREVFLLNDRLKCDCHVAHLDYWRWHYILTCQETGPVNEVTTLWETPEGQIAAVLHPICHDEIRLYVHTHFRTSALENEIITYAEEHHSDWTEGGQRILYVSVYVEDTQRRRTLAQRGYKQQPRWEHHWQRDLDDPIPKVSNPTGYEIRSMGAADELPARSWASWRAFHAEEPNVNYDGDFSWYNNMQSAPLYRRDLDIVAATPEGEIAAFCTISYDDYTRIAVIVLEGTAEEHRQRALEVAITIEGIRRLKDLGCSRVFSIANDEHTESLYRSTMQTHLVMHPWVKVWNPNEGSQE